MKRIPVASTIPAEVQRYDLFVAAIGFESRSRYIAETIRPHADQRVAIGFHDRHEYAYQENLSWFTAAGFLAGVCDDEECKVFVDALVTALTQIVGGVPRICVDISSLSRIRIAHLVNAFVSVGERCTLVVDFMYSLAKYTAPSTVLTPNVQVGPVTEDFAGWTTAPEAPPIAIVGLGYEEERALGAVEHIQASQVWAFIPRSPIAEYEPAVESANQTLLEFVGERRHHYRVDQPLACFRDLESITYGCLLEGNPILFPFGPKIFVLNCLLVAALHDEVAVWRVSPGQLEPAIDRQASGAVYGLRVTFST